jgi:hypothetical protein
VTLAGWDPYGLFERFTERTRRVVVLAQEQARALDHESIGTEHLLLGLPCPSPDGYQPPSE